MARSTIEQAYVIARSGEVADLISLKRRLKADGCRAVDALLTQRNLVRHLEAICAATFQPQSDQSKSGQPKSEADAA